MHGFHVHSAGAAGLQIARRGLENMVVRDDAQAAGPGGHGGVEQDVPLVRTGGPGLQADVAAAAGTDRLGHGERAVERVEHNASTRRRGQAGQVRFRHRRFRG